MRSVLWLAFFLCSPYIMFSNTSVTDPLKIEKVKLEALESMEQMEGWCPRKKAEALFNFIIISKPQIIVEIGVFGGKSLVPMAYAVKANGFGKVYGIDPWNNAEASKGLVSYDRDWWEQVNLFQIYMKMLQKLFNLGLHNYVQIIKYSSEATPLIPEIDLLNIDGNHSKESTYFDVTKWTPCVRRGGLIVLNMHSNSASAVDWLNDNCIKLMEGDDSHPWGIWIKP